MADRRKELAEAKKKLQSQLRSIREIEKRQGGNAITGLLGSQTAEQLAYRGLPLIAADW